VRRFICLSALLTCALVSFVTIPARALSLTTVVVTFDTRPTADMLAEVSGVAVAVHGFKHLPAAVAVVAPGDAGLLANLPSVRRVYPNRAFTYLLRQSTRTVRADQAWDLGYNGAGIGVAVIDAGVDGSRPDLCAAPQFCTGTAVKTVQNVKFVGRQDLGVDPVLVLEDQINTDTSSGHGSHVAGIVGSWGVSSAYEDGKYRGVAWGADIIGLGTGEVATVDNVLAAYDWVIAHRDEYNIRVINNSWGPGAGAPFDPEDPVQRATTAAHDAGIAVVFAAGNEGPTTDTLNAFSANPDAISVAAGMKGGQIAFFSSRGVPGSSFWHPTVTAPGYFIASVRASTGFYGDVADATAGPNPDLVTPPDDVYYATSSGTSMAAPHVAGIVALMQQASFQSRGAYLTPDQIKNILQNTAVSNDPARGSGGLPNYQRYTMGAGYADALAATTAAAAGTMTSAYNPHTVYDVRTFSGDIGPSTVFGVSQSVTSTFQVNAGAISLDAMIDWSQKANGLDLELYNPSGALAHSTFLQCNPDAEPNGFSWFCTQTANQRIVITAPAPGTWTAVARGTISAVDTVRGTWSAVYPDTTTLPPAPAPASITVAASSPPASTTGQSAAGQSVAFVATVHDAAGNALPNAPVAWTSSGVGRIEFGETTTHIDGTADASARSDVAGSQTITASSGEARDSANLTWIGVTLPGTTSTPGRASGGGWIPGASSPKNTFGFWSEYRAEWTGPQGEVSFNDHADTKVKAAGVNRLEITGSTATVTGTATVNGSSGYRFQLTIADDGTPGHGSDTFDLRLTADLDPLWTYRATGTLRGGNIVVTRD